MTITQISQNSTNTTQTGKQYNTLPKKPIDSVLTKHSCKIHYHVWWEVDLLTLLLLNQSWCTFLTSPIPSCKKKISTTIMFVLLHNYLKYTTLFYINEHAQVFAYIQSLTTYIQMIRSHIVHLKRWTLSSYNFVWPSISENFNLKSRHSTRFQCKPFIFTT